MSWRAVCPACMVGNRAEHVRVWNIRPGLIGGAWCDCQGDPNCTDRARASAERLLHEVFGDSLPAASSSSSRTEQESAGER